MSLAPCPCGARCFGLVRSALQPCTCPCSPVNGGETAAALSMRGRERERGREGEGEREREGGRGREREGGRGREREGGRGRERGREREREREGESRRVRERETEQSRRVVCKRFCEPSTLHIVPVGTSPDCCAEPSLSLNPQANNQN